MVIRIDAMEEGPARVLRIAGSVAGSDVAVLRESVSREGIPDRIDLSEVEFVDAAGTEALLGLEGQGAALIGTQPFVDLLLRGPGSKSQ